MWDAWIAAQTAETFKALFPEFTGAPDALVLSRIAMAAERTPASIWGDLRAQGHAYLTAHLLALAPNARDLRLDMKDGKSPYGEHRAYLEGVVSSGYRFALPAEPPA